MSEILALEPGPQFAVPSELEAKIESVRARERTIVASDVKCSETLGLDEFISQFQYERELAFVAERGDEIILALDAARRAGGG